MKAYTRLFVLQQLVTIPLVLICAALVWWHGVDFLVRYALHMLLGIFVTRLVLVYWLGRRDAP